MGLGGYVPVLQQERDIHTASSNYPRVVQLHLELDRVRRHYAHPHTPTVLHLAASAPTRSYQPTDRPHIHISTHPLSPIRKAYAQTRKITTLHRRCGLILVRETSQQCRQLCWTLNWRRVHARKISARGMELIRCCCCYCSGVQGGGGKGSWARHGVRI
jgi:hypothetical protein